MTDTIFELELSKLSRDPKQPRKNFDATALTDLANSIKTEGLIQPIVVRANPNKEGHFYVVAGERRFRAVKKLKMEKVTCFFKPELEGVANVRSVQLAENYIRQDLSLIEIALGVEEYANEQKAATGKKVTNAELAKRYGKNATYWSRVRKLNSAPKVLADHVAQNQLTNVNVISDLVNLNDVSPETFSDVWADYIGGNINSNLEKYVASQLRSAKQIKEFGYAFPTPNENGIFDKNEEMVTLVSFTHFDIEVEIRTLEFQKGSFALGYSMRFFDSSQSAGISNQVVADSHSAHMRTMIPTIANWITQTIERDKKPKYYSAGTKKLFEWINTQQGLLGAAQRFGMPEKPQKQEQESSSTPHLNDALDDAEIQTQTSQGSDTAVLQDADAQTSEPDNVVVFEKKAQAQSPLQGNVAYLSMDIPNEIQQEMSRILGYYHAIKTSTDELTAKQEMQRWVDYLTGQGQEACH